MSDAQLSTIRVYPIKSLDGLSVETAQLGRDGGLVPDRTLAFVDSDGNYVNGKRERAIHRVRASYDTAAGTVTLESPPPERAPTDTPPEPETVSVPGLGDEVSADSSGDDSPEKSANNDSVDTDYERLAAWMSDYVGYDVSVEATEPSYPDDTAASGPTVVSAATLSTVGDWFDFDAHEVLRRFRVNLVFTRDSDDQSTPKTTQPFWEDRLYGDTDEHVVFGVGEATLEGVGPCRRCVVPTRDPDTGEPTPAFRERFVERRRATLPSFSDGPRFDGAFRLTVNTAVPRDQRGTTLRVGDPVRIEGPVSRPE